jgi:hypothetical protein
MKSAYKESLRYIENARANLALSGKDDRFYADVKYVQTASGIAYLGMLKALDYLFETRNIPRKRGRKSIEYYQMNLAKLDKKLLNHLNNAYTILHIEGYYGGITNIKAIESGFDDVISIIDYIKEIENKE